MRSASVCLRLTPRVQPPSSSSPSVPFWPLKPHIRAEAESFNRGDGELAGPSKVPERKFFNLLAHTVR